MADKIVKAWGPRTASVDRPTALEQLQTAPGFPKGAIVHDFREEDGRWLAEVKLAETKESAPPPFPPTDGPADDEAPDSKPPGEDSPADSDSEPSDESKDEPKDKDEKSDKGDSKESLEDTVHELSDLVHAIADKLGVGDAGDDSPLPGDELAGDVPPPPEAPPGPPHAAPGPKPAGKLKPGEIPSGPGVTPIGAPAFASVNVPDDHPWKDLIGKVATITVSEPTVAPLKEAHDELRGLAEPYGYHVRRLREDTEDGQRVVRALISRR